MKITENEILEALRAATKTLPKNPEDAFSIVEMAAATGWSTNRVRAHLITLKTQGQLELVEVQRVSLNGRHQPVMAYRLKPPNKRRRVA